MNFNIEHYKKYRRAAGKPAKDGIWDVTEFPNGLYCFATYQRLGYHGKLKSHPLLGKKLRRIKTDEIFTIDSVCIHWDLGYYYHIAFKDSKNSHSTAIVENINSKAEYVIASIGVFNKKYQIINI